MNLKRTPELLHFLATHFLDTDSSEDLATARAFADSASGDRRMQVLTQAKALLADPEFPTEEFGSEANRWFADADEGKAWLVGIVAAIEEDPDAEESDESFTKDSNGAVLAEGDSVQVIKDLKVKGGSSDLKRGTLIKKVHLIGDPDNIECRVEGSTLVLKTCFLRKV